jgi:hypothetical protein
MTYTLKLRHTGSDTKGGGIGSNGFVSIGDGPDPSPVSWTPTAVKTIQNRDMKEDEKFTFTGPVDPDKPYFAYLVSEYAAGMFAMEPGTIKAVVSEPVTFTGTPTNDAITELMVMGDSVGMLLADEMEALQAKSDSALTDSDIIPLYLKYSAMANDLVDSVYKANTDNLVGVYCANVLTIQARSSAEMKELMEPMSDFVKESELLQQHLNYLMQIASETDGEDSAGD